MTANTPATLPEWPPGHVLAGKYTVRALLARSAWSHTYAATTEPNGEIVLRVFAPDSALERDLLARAASIAKLEPHALPIMEVGRDPQAGVAFVATAHSRHPSLASLVELCPLTLAEGVAFAESLGRALDAAHDVSLFHLALNPSCVFVGPAPHWAVELSGFGMTPRPPFSFSDALWLAPEQLDRQEANATTDVYLAALLVFFALTGKPYWHAQDERTLRQEQRRALTPASLRATELGVTLPHEVDAIFERALSPSMSGRTRTAGDFARALSQACTRKAGLPSIIEPPDLPKVIVREPPPKPPPRIADEPTVTTVPKPEPTIDVLATPALERPARSKRRAVLAALAGAGVALILGSILFAWSQYRKKSDLPALSSALPIPSSAPPAASSTPWTAAAAASSTPPAASSTPPPSDLEPTEAELIVDCRPVQCDIVLVDAKKCTYPDPIRTTPGKHGVGVSAKGYWGDWKLVTLRPGERQTVTFDLRARKEPRTPCPKGQKCP